MFEFLYYVVEIVVSCLLCIDVDTQMEYDWNVGEIKREETNVCGRLTE